MTELNEEEKRMFEAVGPMRPAKEQPLDKLDMLTQGCHLKCLYDDPSCFWLGLFGAIFAYRKALDIFERTFE